MSEHEGERLNVSGEGEPAAEPEAGDQGGGEAQPPKRSRGGRPRGARSHGQLRDRVQATILRLADALQERDPELSQILREDGAAMTSGIIGLVTPFGWLKRPLLAVLSVLEPFLAFGRVGRVVLSRVVDRRAEAREAAAAAAEAEAARLEAEGFGGGGDGLGG